MARRDPYRGFRFRVAFDQVQHGGFSRVKGIARETKFESYREGGVNDFEHKLATLTTYGPLVLERGLADDYLWSWHEKVVEGRIERRDLTVSLHDERDDEVWRWLVERAFPVKWSGTDLDGGSAQVLVESVELVHHGIRRG
jgi:phage tail-like protein